MVHINTKIVALAKPIELFPGISCVLRRKPTISPAYWDCPRARGKCIGGGIRTVTVDDNVSARTVIRCYVCGAFVQLTAMLDWVSLYGDRPPGSGRSIRLFSWLVIYSLVCRLDYNH